MSRILFVQTQGERMRSVFCLGVWDAFHVGHIRFIEKAHTFGDFLAVGIVKDEAVRKQKGDLRPVIPFIEREEIIHKWPDVNGTIALDDFTIPQYIIKKYDIIAVGEDQNHILNLDDVPENKKRIIKRYPHQSTSKIIKRIQDAVNIK